MLRGKINLSRPSKHTILRVALLAITIVLAMVLTSVGANPDPPPGGN